MERGKTFRNKVDGITEHINLEVKESALEVFEVTNLDTEVKYVVEGDILEQLNTGKDAWIEYKEEDGSQNGNLLSQLVDKTLKIGEQKYLVTEDGIMLISE
jgi:hypothetical protein